MPEKDYYQILGVGETVSAKEVRRAFRKLAKEYHPDANRGDKTAEERFKQISEAYEVLSDNDKRAQYDQIRKAREMGFSGGRGFDPTIFRQAGGGSRSTTFRFEDLGEMGGVFSDLFSGASRYGADARMTYRPQKGPDIVYSLTVPFDLAVLGGQTHVAVERSEKCSRCGGAGAEPGTSPKNCPQCEGRGSVSVSQGAFAFSQPCPQCFGRGTIVEKPCVDCRGEGTLRRKRTISVKIPRGINDGAKIRLTGQGEAGIAGGPAGDLYLLVKVAPHAEFERRGNDVYSKVTIDMAHAALGTKVPVNTLAGEVTLSIPPGTQPGGRLRLRGRGVKTAAGVEGHHYVVVEVAVPRELSDERKKLLEDFASAE